MSSTLRLVSDLIHRYHISVKANEGSDDKVSKGKEEEKDVETPAVRSTIMVELLNLARPFTALRALDVDALASKIIKSFK